MVLFSICIATLGRRDASFRYLLEELLKQVNRYKGQIEVVACWNNGEKSIGEIRQQLLESAKGEYVCFIDDDDMVPDYYCHEIMKALGEDYVGFRVAVFKDDVRQKQSINNLEYPNWHETDEAYCRDISHLNPIKREIALRGSFTTNGAGEDESWSRTVKPLTHTQNFIDKEMYFYNHSSVDTSFGGWNKAKLTGKFKRPEINNKYFRYMELK